MNPYLPQRASSRLPGALALALMFVVTACERGADDRQVGGIPSLPSQGAPYPGGTNDPDPVEESCTPGDERSCKNVVEDAGEVLACVVGTQHCNPDGSWSDCEGSLSFVPDGVQPKSGSFQLTASGPQTCPNNVCDPSCKVFPEESGVSCSISITGGGGQVSSLPSGFQNKGLKDALHPPSSGCTSSADCQFDHYCDPTACSGSKCGICKPWPDGAYDASLSEPDYTLRVPCDGGKVQVCNRGGATAPSGAKIAVVSGNSSQLQKNLGKCSSVSGSSAGSCLTGSSIPPGQCVEVTGCASSLKGTRALVVNSPAFAPPLKSEADCANNWSVYHSSVGACSAGSYQPLEHSVTYTATCASGQQPRWTLLAYKATLPTNPSGAASLTVDVEAATSSLGLDPDCLQCTRLASAPAIDPAICSMAGPAPSCPKNLGAALGQAASAPHLQVLFTLWPTPDGALPATLDNWEVSYTCVDDQ
jgi:hypothetical protein